MIIVLSGITIRASELKEEFAGAAATKPATLWVEGMLTGNGNMGGIASGNPYDETIVINQQECFLPRYELAQVPRMAPKIPELKKQALEAGNKGPMLFHEKIQKMVDNSRTFSYDANHPAFFLKISMAPGKAENYMRTQNFKTGELVTKWSDENGNWERRLFISRPADVAVLQIKGPEGKVSCSLKMEIENEFVKPEFESRDGFISAHTIYVKGKGGYDSIMRVVAENGTVSHTDSGAVIADANEVLLLMHVKHWYSPLPRKTNDAWKFSSDNPYYESKEYKTNYVSEMRTRLTALPANYQELLKPHADIHGELFSRVKIDLGGSNANRQKTSEQLMTAGYSQALLERTYDACRYMMICSNGRRPPHLQGIWNGSWKPAWGCGYHLDSNLQLCIQGNMSANLPELMEGYFNLVESWLPDCKLNAREFYGFRGAVSRVGVVSSDALMNKIQKFPGELYFGCLGWLTHFFYDYYQFTGDKEFLENRAVPLLKEVVLFYEDLLKDTEGKDGKYRFFISASPENGHLINSSFDIAIAKAMHQYLINACRELDIEQENIPKWEAFIAKLPPYLINGKGELQEWAVKGAVEKFNHRHHSRFLPLYQFCEFDPDRTPDLWAASHKAFNGKIRGWFKNYKNPNSRHITHGMANQGQCAARLGRGDIVHDMMERLITKGYMLPNFMMHYWPNKGKNSFGMDPTGSIPDIINNSLLFAWGGVLDILPALPEQWANGSISGILLRGQITVDSFSWKQAGCEMELSLTSKKAQNITIRLPSDRRITSIEVVKGNASAAAFQGKAYCHRLVLPAGEQVTFRISSECTVTPETTSEHKQP